MYGRSRAEKSPDPDAPHPAGSLFERALNRLREARRTYAGNASLRLSVFRTILSSVAVLFVASCFIFFLYSRELALEIFFCSLAVVALYTVFLLCNLDLARFSDGRSASTLSAANVLTAARIFSAAPMLILLLRDLLPAGFVLYCAAAVTDVLDGAVARRFDQETVLGVILDPVGDILVTIGVFFYLWIVRDVPLWLFILLVVRYTQFFVGLAVLSILGVVPVLRATIAGKIAGVVQGAGIVILLARRLFFMDVSLGAVHRYLLPALGCIFALVIVSQTVIGWEAIRSNQGAR